MDKSLVKFQNDSLSHPTYLSQTKSFLRDMRRPFSIGPRLACVWRVKIIEEHQYTLQKSLRLLPFFFANGKRRHENKEVVVAGWSRHTMHAPWASWAEAILFTHGSRWLSTCQWRSSEVSHHHHQHKGRSTVASWFIKLIFTRVYYSSCVWFIRVFVITKFDTLDGRR